MENFICPEHIVLLCMDLLAYGEKVPGAFFLTWFLDFNATLAEMLLPVS